VGATWLWPASELGRLRVSVAVMPSIGLVEVEWVPAVLMQVVGHCMGLWMGECSRCSGRHRRASALEGKG
jgi:hypothetical protein